jgi:hypothetical protein
MALAPVANRDAQAVASPPPGAQKTAAQFSKAALQASRAGDAANTTGSDGRNTAVKADLSRVQSRGERDHNQSGQQLDQGVTVRYAGDQKITSNHGHVSSRVNVGGKPQTSSILAEPPRNTSQAAPTAGKIVTTLRILDNRSSRFSETGKASTDSTTATTSLLNPELAVRGQQNNEGNSGGGNNNGNQNNSSPDGNQGEDGAEENTGDIGGIGNQPPRGGPPAGAAPEEPEEPDEVDGVSNLGEVSEEARLQINEEWRATDPYFRLMPDKDDSISSLLAGIELSQRSEDKEVQDDQRSFIAKMRVPLKLLASCLISSYQEGPVGNPPACGLTIIRTPFPDVVGARRLSPEETAELIEALLASKIDSPDRERLVLNSIDFILNYSFALLADIYKSQDDLREAFALTTRHDIVDHSWDPNHHVFTLSALAENEIYQASSIELIRSPERDKVMEYFVSSMDDANRKANIIAVIMATGLPAEEAIRKLDAGDATLAQQLERFLLTGKWQFRTHFANIEQNAAITSRFVDFELSRPGCDVDLVMPRIFGFAPLTFKTTLKNFADFLVTGESTQNNGRKMPAQFSVDEALDLIESLVASKSNIVRPEAILSNSFAFITRYVYIGDSDKVFEDCREAFALARRHDVAQPISGAMRALSLRNQDLLNSDSRDAVMAYFLSSSDVDSRKAAVADNMMTRSVSAIEAARDLDLG